MKSPIRTLVSFVKRTLRQTGYDIVRLDAVGKDPFADVKQLFDDHSATILDVGANVGNTTHVLLNRFPNATVYALEPYPPACDTLRARFDGLPNLTVCNLGLGVVDGVQTLFVHKASVGNSFLQISEEASKYATHDWTRPTSTAEVPVRRLDTFCEQNAISSIDFLKIDAQGYDGQILEGASRLLRQQKIRAIFIEVLFVPLYEDQDEFETIYRNLHGYGYRLVGLYNAARHANNYVMWCDALFVAV